MAASRVVLALVVLGLVASASAAGMPGESASYFRAKTFDILCLF